MFSYHSLVARKAKQKYHANATHEIRHTEHTKYMRKKSWSRCSSCSQFNAYHCTRISLHVPYADIDV